MATGLPSMDYSHDIGSCHFSMDYIEGLTQNNNKLQGIEISWPNL
jgi:hypothetical protein